MTRQHMLAAVLTGHGGPEQLEVRDDVPIPRPGRGEVLVQVTAAAVNNTDLWTREGAYGRADDPQSYCQMLWTGWSVMFRRRAPRRCLRRADRWGCRSFLVAVRR